MNEMIQNDHPGIGVRYVQVALMISWNVLYTSMVNGFPMILVAMTNPATSPNPKIPTFTDWNDETIILSAFFWGFVGTQLFGGYFGRKYGFKWFMVASTVITSVLSYVLPSISIEYGSIGLIFGVLLIGLAQGFCFSMLPVFISTWIPIKEKTTLGNAVYAGYGLGCVMGINIATYSSTSRYGWPLAFYITGTMQLLWVIFMSIYGENYPENHSSISSEEKKYIASGKNLKKETPIPWKDILNSKEVWSLWVANGGAIIITWLSAAEFPSYLSAVFGFTIKEVGKIMTLAFLLIGLLGFTVGTAVKYCIDKWNISTGIIRKICNTIAAFGTSFLLIFMGFLKSADKTTVVYLTLGIFSFNSASFCGYLLNYNDISPNFCGIIFGIGGLISSIMNIANPILIDVYVRDQSDPREWELIFWSSAVVMIISNLIFIMFGSGEKQEWDDRTEDIGERNAISIRHAEIKGYGGAARIESLQIK